MSLPVNVHTLFVTGNVRISMQGIGISFLSGVLMNCELDAGTKFVLSLLGCVFYIFCVEAQLSPLRELHRWLYLPDYNNILLIFIAMQRAG